jgi:ABC-2 type transport system ATP-binding protein
MTNILEAKGLKKYYKMADGKTLDAVSGVDLSIAKGEIFSLLGPNGAGKTTTISMISGLIAPSEGDATIGGYSIVKQPLQAKKLLGVIPQEIALYPELSAKQNLAFFGRMYGLSGKELDKRIDEVLDFIDLRERQNERIETFSGGMKRRVNIGVGLLHRPELVYMDEPTVGIDPQNRRRILDTVLRLRDEYKMTILYTTHMMEEAQELSDRVAIMDFGKIIALGTQGELTQAVGEEDRLIMSINAATLPDGLEARLKGEVEGVTRIEMASEEAESGGVAVAEKTGLLTVYAKRGRKALPRLLSLLEQGSIDVQSVEVREPDLEAVFLHLTGRALRD